MVSSDGNCDMACIAVTGWVRPGLLDQKAVQSTGLAESLKPHEAQSETTACSQHANPIMENVGSIEARCRGNSCHSQGGECIPTIGVDTAMKQWHMQRIGGPRFSASVHFTVHAMWPPPFPCFSAVALNTPRAFSAAIHVALQARTCSECNALHGRSQHPRHHETVHQQAPGERSTTLKHSMTRQPLEHS